VFVGDEHAVIRAAGGTLPGLLEHEPLLTVPRAMARILRTYERLRHGVASPGGQISSRLSVLTPLALKAILDPEPDVFRVLTDEELRPSTEAVTAEAADKGIPLTPIAAELAAAAREFDSEIWLGHDRNLPRWALHSDTSLSGVRWRRLSDLIVPDNVESSN